MCNMSFYPSIQPFICRKAFRAQFLFAPNLYDLISLDSILRKSGVLNQHLPSWALYESQMSVVRQGITRSKMGYSRKGMWLKSEKGYLWCWVMSRFMTLGCDQICFTHDNSFGKRFRRMWIEFGYETTWTTRDFKSFDNLSCFTQSHFSKNTLTIV